MYCYRLSYNYVDSKTPRGTPFSFRSFNNTISDGTSSLARTSNQAVAETDKLSNGYIFYNDDQPDYITASDSSNMAHAKGVLHWTPTGGFWLIHSMPKFADGPGSNFAYNIPSSGSVYGQSYICLSVSVATIEKIAVQMQYNRVQIYSSNFPTYTTLYSSYTFTITKKLIADGRFLNPTYWNNPASNVASIRTIGGLSFTHFAKNLKWNQDLYSKLVAPYFKTSLACETWMRPLEPPYYVNNATLGIAYEVINVNSVKIPGTTSWTETSDHSKWCVSLRPSIPIVCIGDINRQASQWKRGGGTLCINSPALHKLFSNIAIITETYTAPTGAQGVYPAFDGLFPTQSCTTGTGYTCSGATSSSMCTCVNSYSGTAACDTSSGLKSGIKFF